MIEKNTTRMRLCPQCANSIEEDAEKCSYCKTELLSDSAPQWLNRGQSSSESRVGPGGKKKLSISSKLIWPAATLVVALTAFLAGGYMRSHELSLASQVSLKQLQAKDQAIQSQEAQLAQTRQQLNDDSNKLAEMKTKLDESQKELAATQQRLGAATREANRLAANRSTAVTRTASRAPDTAYRAPSPAAPAAARRTVEPGVYETIQATSVYDNPSSAGRVITQIGKGIKINVIGSTGDWLEVRSKHGNPPGYVRSDDARLMVAERAENPEGAAPASRSSRRSSASPRNDRFDAPIPGRS